MIRIRRLPTSRFRRAKYEVEYAPGDPGVDGWFRTTKNPIFDLEGVLGTGDAWALIVKVNDDWRAGNSGWVTDAGHELPDA